MNIQEMDIMNVLAAKPYTNQRLLAEHSGHSLGIVNRSVKTLMENGYLDEDMQLTAKAKELLADRKPRNAIILAAGFGMRMVPINLSVPKALLEVKGEPLVERLIRQLREAGIRKITIVVGFMKESFEYLIDKYDIDLVVNSAYASKNNLASLALVADKISNTYIVPSDLWCSGNPFHSREMYSWYMIADEADADSEVRLNRKMELVKIGGHSTGNRMVGIAYLQETDALNVRRRIRELTDSGAHDEDFWETALYKADRMIIPAKVVPSSEVVEINTYEQLRELDGESAHLKSDALDVIASVFHITSGQITDISVLKKGMTNRSFLFSVKGEKYIMRIPGEGTDRLINREQEASVYDAISGLGLCDDPVYINPANGYKITKFLDGIRTCDPENTEDLSRCMKKLREFHQMKLQVGHTFDIFGQIDFYESLWKGQKSVYRDYAQTKDNVFSLRAYINGLEKDWCLTHIDAVPDNFLFYSPGTSSEKDTDRQYGDDRRQNRGGDKQDQNIVELEEQLQLTDWEYAGMQDPHVDIAMFCIYSMYDKEQVDRLIDIYFDGQCERMTRAKIYAYISACGLLWSNWCEFKRNLGVEFGEYSLRQYRFAKDYYRFAIREFNSEQTVDTEE